MALDQWNIEPAKRVCSASGDELCEGQEFFAVLFEDGEGFRREEYAVESWTGPPDGAFCHFRSRVPIKAKKQRLLVDDEMLIHFFLRLGDTEDPSKRRFRFVLALILMRKRILKFDQTHHREDGEWWEMRLAREPADGAATKDAIQWVCNPLLDDDQIESVSRELSVILHGSDQGDEDEENTEGMETSGGVNDA